MMRMWKWIALAVLLLGIAGILRLHRGGPLWKSGLSLDATVVLFVGLIAFLAVMIQIEEDRIKRFEDQEREKKAVATAILFEIDLIYSSMIRDTGEAMQNAIGREFAVKPHPLRFTVYERNVCKIGQLPTELGQEIVIFYGSATRILITLQVYSDAVRNAHVAPGTPGTIDWKTLASQYYEETVKAIPCAKLLAYLLTRRLCDYTGVEFRPPQIAAAAEKLADLQELVKKAEETASSTDK